MTRFVTGRAPAWIVLVLTVLVAGGLFALGTGASGTQTPESGLPDASESARAAAIVDDLDDGDSSTALLVYTREGAGREGGTVDEADLAAIRQTLPALGEFGQPVPPQLAEDGSSALVVLVLDAEPDVDLQAERAAGIRDAAAVDGLTLYLSGPEGFAVDVAGIFAGADVTLLIFTAAVVAVLLLVTYRSPVLWLVPLAVVGLGDALAGIVATRVAALFEITLDPSVRGILSVLVFGAGTNYALLLIARYRDELRKHEDRREAMRRSLRGAGPAVLASGSTVVLALFTLLLASLGSNRALGLACAIGVLVAMAFALIVLPAALVQFPRGIFWPLVPEVGTEPAVERSVWGRLGRGVAKRPTAVAVLGVLVLLGLAAGGLGAKTGLSQTERFLDTPDAVIGQELLAEGFSQGGSGSPTTVVVRADEADAAVTAAESVTGVVSVAEQAEGTSGGDDWTELSVAIEGEPESDAAFATVADLREALPASALVGGLDAEALDVADATAADQALLIPLILALVFVVLVVLLRALLAPVLLLVTVVGSFFASVGASWLLFQHVFGFPALDGNVLLLSFLFLVALGVDYNIFLVTRAREEAAEHGTREGMVRALAATGGVITSAGVLLAAVFAVLGVLPLITLTQIGIIVCVGVLLDTLLVRTVIVPALAFLAGERFWWPRKRPA
ncbi:MMPL family transporter [Arenivirga flava]|nr:MMPL family transporter [Arenivirga flava]